MSLRRDCRLASVVCAAILLACSSLVAQTKAHRPRILGIAQVELGSTDTQEAGAFFTKLFAAEGASAKDCAWGNISQVDGDFNFHSFCAGQNLRLRAGTQPTPSNLLAEVMFETDDLKSLKQYLAAHKVPISKKSTGEFALAIDDPDGHRIRFFQFPENRTPSSRSGLRIIHAGFIVRDRAAMEHFYKDILGFRPYWHGGMKDDQADWEALQVPDGTDWVEFMLNVPENADHRLLGIMNHIALGVTDIHETAKQLQKNGLQLTEEPKIGRDGKWQLNVYDPDQTRIEFMEFTPVQKPCCSEFTGPHPKP